MSEGILNGLRIVEVSAFVAAPLGGMTLAQMGADVIRIDPLSGGLDYRRWPVTDEDVSLFWAGLNKGKRSVAIDVGRPEGRELATALITASGREAGILLTNLPARGWLDFESLRRRRQDLIQVTIQGNRSGGSMVDYTVNPTLGLPHLTGPDGTNQPTNHVLPAWDLVTGQMAALGLLAAERHRNQTGDGQHVKLALEDVGLAVMSHLGFIAEAQMGVRRERYGNYLFGAYGRDFLTRDGERVMIVALTLKQWNALVEATHLSNEVKALGDRVGADLSREGERFLHRQAISALIDAWVVAHTYADVEQSFGAAGVCWSRYQTVEELAKSDAVSPKANPMFESVYQPGIGLITAASSPLEFSAAARVRAHSAPTLGEHTEAVLSELLELSAVEIEHLRQVRVIA